MEGKNTYSHLALGSPGIFRHILHLPNDSANSLNKARFYKAFTSKGRAEGTCRLTLIWQKGIQRKTLEAHHYLLCFNHEGIKDYLVEDITSLGLRGWQNRLGYTIVPIGPAEAASLIQDAYEQNKRFQTKPPQGITDSHLLLEYDTVGVERFQFIYRLFPKKIDVQMFTNIYLSALKRLDRGLLYDLSHWERQRKLGNRLDYLRDGEDELSYCTFLRTGITAVEVQGLMNWVEAYVVLSTPQDDIVRIRYQIQVLAEKGQYFVVDFKESGRERLVTTHPDNPLNYKVFAAIYRHNGKEAIERWLEEQPGMFLGGELTFGEVYKWLNGGSEPWEEFDFSQAISAEIFLTNKELLVFSRKPEKLAGISRLLAEDLRGVILVQGQYYLQISQLYSGLLASEEWGSSDELAVQLQEQRANSYILLLDPRGKERFTAYIGKIAARTVSLGQGAAYYLIQNDQVLAEIYTVGRWLKLSVYTGTVEKELASFQTSFKIVDIIKDSELENHYDLFTPPLSEQRKWMIFRQLRLLGQEARLIKDMGLVPSVREAAQQLGVVI